MILVTAPDIYVIFNEIQQMMEYYNNESAWTLSKDDGDIKFYKGTYPGSSFEMLKSQMIDENLHDGLIKNLDTIEEVDESMPKEKRHGTKRCFSFGHLNDEKNTYYFYMAVESGNWLVSDREFLMLRRKYAEDNKLIWLNVSVDGEDIYPVQGKNVRGKTTFQGFILEKVDDKTDKLTFIMHTDPCGSVPAMVFNFAATNQGITIKRIADKLKKEKN